MTARWLIAKYIPDLRRREPINVGVILSLGDSIAMRFAGERADGTIDGRTARSWVGSTPNYKRWVEYWRHVVTSGELNIESLVTRRSDDSYYLDFGGERLAGNGTDAGLLLEQLYTTLVEDVPAMKQLDVTQLAERVLETLQISPQPFAFDVPLPNGSTDRVTFDYRYDNGQPNLMHRVSLTFEDDRSWSFVHAANWAFSQASQVFQGEAQAIALVKPRQEDADLERQLLVLEQYAHVVDVSHQDLAASQLKDLLHLVDPQLHL